jgi:glycosyltransferase involved in cell wall biosynthesis
MINSRQMKIKVVLVHQAFVTGNEPGGTRHFELGRRLVANGHRFSVVTSDVGYQSGRRLVIENRFVTRSEEEGVSILRTRTFASLHKSYVRRVLAFLAFMANAVIVGSREPRPDVVMGTTPPIFQAISAWLLSVIHRRPLLLEVRDLWPEFAIDIGLLRNPILIRLSRWLESFLYTRADHILVNSPAYCDYLVGKGVAGQKVSLIPNGADPTMFDPDERGAEFRRQHGCEDKFVFTYAGAIGLANDIDQLMKAAAALRSREDIAILIVGDGKERKRLERMAAELELNNVVFTGALPKSSMKQVLAASDACIAILKNIPMFTTTYPNKVFDYMAAGRPTLLAIDGVIRKVIEAAQGGIFVPPGQPDLLAAAMKRMADAPEASRQMGWNAREHVLRYFNRDKQAQDFEELLCWIAAGAAPRSRASLAAADM